MVYSYGASKAAIHHLTQILASDLAKDNITINALAPGAFYSRMMAYALDDQGSRDQLISTTPLKRLGQAQDIAGAALFLSSAAGAYVTGAIIPVDGGMIIAE
ncbi:MAG: hypothetical protein COB36_09350 [Alphaproteobacteria bacterium]|nr:MAG: hypothetical protein COB36_09350 [Alphaproteobacteria bacterium]